VNPIPGPFAPSVVQHVVSGSTTDRYGNKVATFTTKPARKALAQYPGDAEEVDNPGRDVVTADEVLIVPSDWTVSATDEWTLADGDRYKVDGKPSSYRHPRTGTQLTQIRLRRIS
jgi:hypothetical protein